MKRYTATLVALLIWSAAHAQDASIAPYTLREITQQPRFPNQAQELSCTALPDGVARDGFGPGYRHESDAGQWEDLEQPPGDHFAATDACGLRLTNLSGVWESGGQQYVVSHDPRTGRFASRHLYVPPDREPRKTWRISLGDLDMEGRLHDSEMWLDVEGVFPPSWQTRCPDSFRTRVPAATITLGMIERGSRVIPQLTVMWPRLRIQSDCSVIYMEANRLVLHEVEYTP